MPTTSTTSDAASRVLISCQISASAPWRAVRSLPRAVDSSESPLIRAFSSLSMACSRRLISSSYPSPASVCCKSRLRTPMLVLLFHFDYITHVYTACRPPLAKQFCHIPITVEVIEVVVCHFENLALVIRVIAHQGQ